MFIKRLRLQNFRCFEEQEYTFSDRFIILEGKNGVGKSSILEALHYACYLRSFRTHSNRDLIKIDKDYFFIEIEVDHDLVNDQIQVGFDSAQGKVVKFNQKPILSYRDLILQYRTVSLCADDIIAVSGEPDYRRDFLNQSVLLLDPARYAMFKKFKQIVEQRKNLLQQIRRTGEQGGGVFDQVTVWSEKLWDVTVEIKKIREEYLKALEHKVNQLLAEYFFITEPELQVKFKYFSKNFGKQEQFYEFWPDFYEKYYLNEVEQGRSFFGAHLDDFGIEFFGKRAKIYASRGQQKLIIFLMKVSQLDFMKSCGKPGVLLLDDFLTDFDKQNSKFGIELLKSKNFQVFLTNPNSDCIFDSNNSSVIRI